MTESVTRHSTSGTGNSSEERVDLIGRFRENVIGFERAAVKHFGAAGGMIARQLLFWDGKGASDDFWIYKSHAEWYEDTGLKRRAQESGRNRLIKAGVMREEKRIGPDRRWRLFFRLYPWRLMDAVGEDLPNAAKSPANSTVSHVTQTMADVTQTMADVTGYTEEYPEDHSEEVSPQSPPRGANPEGKEKAGSVRNPSDTASFDAKRNPKQNRASEEKVKERAPRKSRRSRAGTVQTPGEGLQALTDHRDRFGGASMEHYVPVAKRWDFTQDNPPWWVMKDLDNDHKKLDRIERIVRGAVRKAEVDALNAKKERGHVSPDSTPDAPVQASPSLADPNSVEAMFAASRAQEAENTALLKAYMKAYPERCAFDGF